MRRRPTEALTTQREFEESSSADNSCRAYASDLRIFRAWGGSIPSTPQQVADFIAAYGKKRKPATLRRWMASISKAHREAYGSGGADPCRTEKVRDTFKGIVRKNKKPRRQVAPAVVDELVAMLDKTPDTLAGLRDRALLLLGFSGAFRRSELVALTVDDVAFDPRGMLIAVVRSKTDQQGEGATVAVPYADGKHCPVKTLKAWLAHVKASKSPEGPIFRRISRAGTIHADALNPATVAAIVKARGAAAGLDPNLYAGHSLRAGLATSAARAKKDRFKIKAQTRHKTDAQLDAYVRIAELFDDNAAALL